MPQLRGKYGDLPDLHLDLTAAEYRLMADLLLDHVGSDAVRSDQFSSLVQRLFVLAVKADQDVAEITAD